MIRRVRLTGTFIVIIAVIALILGGCSAKQENPNVPVPAVVSSPIAKETDLNQYTIDAVLDTVNKVLSAEQQVVYVNNEDVGLSELYFHIYANAFGKQETAPFLFDDFSRAYNRGFMPGYTEIESIELSKGQNRNTPEYSLQGEGDTILRIKLPEPLKPKDSINIRFRYRVIIPPAGDRFGYGDVNINMGNWYPVAAVYDNEGWNLDKYYSVGDPFYSDVSDYVINIRAPEEYSIAASGYLSEERAEGGNKSWKFRGSSMRDFAFIAGDSFLIAEDKVGDTVIKSYYYKDHEKRGKEALEIGKRSIEIFNNAFGKYPYHTYSIVETEFPSGMEYPGLVYISSRYYDTAYSVDNLTYTTVHETAHQWWYGVVGNDQIDEAWLDEGFATYSEGVYTEKEYGKGNGDFYYEYLEESAKEDIKSRAYDGVILKPLSGYENWDDYGPAVYTGGAMLLNEIRKQVGDQTFFKIMQTYYDEYSFKIASTEDFLRICEEVSSTEFDELFQEHLSSGK